MLEKQALTWPPDLAQLWHPVPDKVPRWVGLSKGRHERLFGPLMRSKSNFSALGVRIEDAEVWAGVDASTGTPLPSTIVGRQITVNQLFHEVLEGAQVVRRLVSDGWHASIWQGGAYPFSNSPVYH